MHYNVISIPRVTQCFEINSWKNPIRFEYLLWTLFSVSRFLVGDEQYQSTKNPPRINYANVCDFGHFSVAKANSITNLQF